MLVSILSTEVGEAEGWDENDTYSVPVLRFVPNDVAKALGLEATPDLVVDFTTGFADHWEDDNQTDVPNKRVVLKAVTSC